MIEGNFCIAGTSDLLLIPLRNNFLRLLQSCLGGRQTDSEYIRKHFFYFREESSKLFC
jgi:hypothetical protein